VRFVRLAAENGLAPAQYRLGKLFETGENVAKDLAEARRWMERAAEGGHRRAMHTLAIFYAEGRGAPQDFAAAARWFEQASLYGATDSQYNLAVLYEQGLGVPMSLADAYAWYAIAGRSGDADAAGRADALASRLSAEAKAGADQAIAAFRPEPVDQAANGVFRDLPWDRPQLTGASAIARAQTLLAAMGYEVGAPDGVIGQRTRTAIIEYQREAGLRQTGAVDTTLLERLEADQAR
jgi:localization factor PodJL